MSRFHCNLKEEISCNCLFPAAMALLACVSLNAGGIGQVAPENPDEFDLGGGLRVKRLTDSVWIHDSVVVRGDWGAISANGLLFVDGGEAAMIDTPWTPEQTELLFEWAQETLKSSIRLAVPTHSHDDCIGGLGPAHRLGARSAGHALTADFARETGVEGPQVTFKERTEEWVGNERILLLYPGPGHTRDNIVVWIPSEGVLFGGCLIKNASTRNIGYIAEADLSSWPAALERVVAAFPAARWIVPGHGAAGQWDTIENTRKILQEHRDGDPQP